MGLLFRRIVLYVVGLLILAFGVAFSVNSNLGVSPVNSLPYVISQILKVDLGVCVTSVFSCYILIQILLLRKNFRWIDLTQMVFSTLFGYFVDLAKWVLGDFALPTYVGRLAMLAISIVLIAIGVSLYMDAKLVNMPMEGMTHAVKETLLKKLPFHDVKVIMDCLSVGVGIVLSLLFFGKLVGIREGTVISALVIGKVMKPVKRLIGPAVERFCNG